MQVQLIFMRDCSYECGMRRFVGRVLAKCVAVCIIITRGERDLINGCVHGWFFLLFESQVRGWILGWDE